MKYPMECKKKKRKQKENVPFKIISAEIKHLGINLTKDVKDLYADNYKTFIKETEYYSKKWKDIPCSWIGIIYIVKTVILSKAIYKFNVIPIKLLMTFFTVVEQIILFLWNMKDPGLPRISEEEQESKKHKLPRLQTILQSYSNQNTVILAQKQIYGSTEQNRETEINPYTYSQGFIL